MNRRAELADGRPIELFGRIYTWSRENGPWSLRLDEVEAERTQLVATVSQAVRAAELHAARGRARAELAALPGFVASHVVGARLARVAAARAGDLAYRPARKYLSHAAARALGALTTPATQPAS